MERPRHLVIAVIAVSGLASMWMSNTATAAMMLTVLVPILGRSREGLSDSDQAQADRLDRALLLAVPFATNIGGIGTPIGTPPNAIALGALRQAGVGEITFFHWMLIGVPLAVLLLSVLAAVLTRGLPHHAEADRTLSATPPALRPRGIASAAVLILSILLWLTGALHGIPDGVVALIAASLLVSFGLIGRQDVNSIEWTVLLLMWGGLTLSVAMESTGVVSAMVEHLPEHVGFIFVIGLMFAACAVSTFMSNTATAALLIPIVLAMAVPEAYRFAVLTAFACSFAMAMPVSTPPNALAFSTGRLRSVDMIRTGLVMSIICLVITIAGYRFVLPWAIPMKELAGTTIP